MDQKRRNYFIDKKFQSDFIVKFCIVVIIASVIIGFLIAYFSKNFTTVAIENTRVLVKTAADFMLPVIIITIIIVNFFTAIAVIALTMFTSHKIAGPLYRLKREIQHLQKGNLNANFKIRKTDQLQDFASALSDLSDMLRDRYTLLKDKTEQLKKVIDSSCDNKEVVSAKLSEIEDLLKQFKI